MPLTLKNSNYQDKTVLLRADLDVPLVHGQVTDSTRLEHVAPTLNFLSKSAAHILVIGHLGRPEGKIVPGLEIAPVAQSLLDYLEAPEKVSLLENLRFNPGEEQNDQTFAQSLADQADIFINDAFAASHRSHASIVGIPKYLPSSLGLHFEAEINALDKVLKNPTHPILAIIGGAKLETKIPLLQKLVNKVDQLIIGGKLVQEITPEMRSRLGSKTTILSLRPDGLDINEQAINQCQEHIAKAGTIVWNGPLGKFEDKKAQQGTQAIAQAINQAKAYAVIGGGDTEAAATLFNAESGLDHISSGGGAMLTYLATGTLVGLDAIKKSQERHD